MDFITAGDGSCPRLLRVCFDMIERGREAGLSSSVQSVGGAHFRARKMPSLLHCMVIVAGCLKMTALLYDICCMLF